jgi:putative transposase
MLEPQTLAELFAKLSTPHAGQELVRKARRQAPVRDVQSRGGNVVTIFQSHKMGTEIRTESRHIEFPGAINHEFDPKVIEFYAQPCTLNLTFFDSATNKTKSTVHTPDFLVLHETGITLEEWKSETKLTRLAERYPYRYELAPDGSWRSPQIEQYLAGLGIAYKICSERTIPRMRVENIFFLEDYLHPGAPSCDPEEIQRLTAVLKIETSLFLADLTAAPHNFDVAFLYKAVADRLVVADLDTEPLSNAQRCRLYRDRTSLEFVRACAQPSDALGQHKFVLDLSPGTYLHWHEKTLEILLVEENEVICRDISGQTVPLTKKWILKAHDEKQLTITNGPDSRQPLALSQYTEKDLEAALKRQAILNSPEKIVSERTLRSWRSRLNVATANGDIPSLALIPKVSARGNRTARFSSEQESLLNHVIHKRWKTNEAINYTTLYRWVCTEFDQAGLKAPSYPTVIARIKAQQSTHDVRIRHGKRRAYQQDEFVNVLYADTPLHGSRAFQYVHIDHTQLDIELISDQTGKRLGRPWLSMAVDAFSRRILGFYLTYDPPSYHSVMMLMRDIVRRFERLPNMIVVDNGRDLTSEAFVSFLRVMNVHLRLRPAGQPRAGAIMERIFGTAHSQYIHNLAGNTKATKEVRMTTGSHLPSNLAQWSLTSLYYGLQYWATQYYDKEWHPALRCSPAEMFTRSLAQSGIRSHRHVLWNEDFLIATCPPANRGAKRKVNNQRGVKVHDHYYWDTVFRDPKVAGTNVIVRYDPWDASTVYAHVNNKWVRAKCRTLVGLGQLTETERRALTEEYVHRSGKSLHDSQTPERIREFLKVFKPEGAIELTLERQQENKSLYGGLGLSTISQIPPVLDRMSLTPSSSTSSVWHEDPSLETTQEDPAGSIKQNRTNATAKCDFQDLPDFDSF